MTKNNTYQIIHRRLEDFDFKGLLIEELGWDHCQQNPLIVHVDGNEYTLNAATEKRGMVVFIFEPGTGGNIPEYHIRKKIEYQVTKKSAYEHIIIFVDAAKSTQIWQWVRREPGKPAACREQSYHAGKTGQALIQKLQEIAFDLQEEEKLDIYTVTKRAKKAFDVEKVTKKFYERFKKEHKRFLSFIEGIKKQNDREWYASLMLNRMMFVYFIQKKGFLDNDLDYLKNRLGMMQEKAGNGRFHEFYRFFLLRLFHEGLGQPESERNPELVQLLGKVPYLNGGLFDVHVLEREYPDINIPDEAFEQIFNFFDDFTWHLDDRPLREDNEINPDVLGYIFEKYINQKQMGAYYTKEDITGYISRNTVIPYLFKAAEKEYKQAFVPDGPVWRLLKENPDRYIYEAVRQGVDLDLPENIVQGIDDVAKRTDWNKPADPGHALPTETWREFVARRNRCLELREKLKTGEITNINDLITYNLDICQFAQDVIENCESPELLRAFWIAIAGRIPGKSNETFRQGMTILDPTCGSGAFLFAALNTLEPLYEACLEQMRRFVSQLETIDKKLHDFRGILDQVAPHPNERYFVYKSIIINNLYGVDIMAEAVEICKLRLFLKLVAQVDRLDQLEPLPDIDFNIRTGNTLVGFATHHEAKKTIKSKFDFDNALGRIEENSQLADRAFQRFRQMQTKHGMSAADFSNAKENLRNRLDKLRDELDLYLAGDYGVDTEDQDKFTAWRNSHQPFHWFVEFYGIIHSGGFDVIIGNPPYIEYSKIRRVYFLKNLNTIECGNLYAFCIERSYILLNNNSRFGFIVQAPIVSTTRMKSIRVLLRDQSKILYYSTYDDRPSKLFDGMHHCRVAIILSGLCKRTKKNLELYTTRYHKWYREERPTLFPSINYIKVHGILSQSFVPKFRTSSEFSIYNKIMNMPVTLGDLMSPNQTAYQIYYKITGVGHWFTFTINPPKFWRNGIEGSSTRENSVSFSEKVIRDTVFCCLYSTTHYWLYQCRTNCRDFNPTDIKFLPIPKAIENGILDFEKICIKITNCLEKNSELGIGSYSIGGDVRYQKFKPGIAKEYFDNIDHLLAKYYGFTDEELDFIINYDIKYRMGKNLNNAEDSN